ncbi:MAG TPA: AAA family ATPase [Tepidisphaeraceae bacterium]|jgi:capsular exopolysaccharide synthesis family protein|nr:AAA family ATPase [Tepidisphaeraceae bacterium]
MSQEIQLSLTPSPQGSGQQTSSWGTSVASAMVPANPQQQTALATVHSQLRGRYKLTIIFAVIFACLGGATGFLLFHQGYQSIGLIEIQPVISTPELYDRIMPLYQQYIATVVTTLHSEKVITWAMKSPDWKKHRPNPPDTYLAEWNKNLLVKLVPNSFDINVTFTDDHKDGKEVAPIAVASVIQAYTELYGNEQKIETSRKIDVWQERVRKLHQEINEQQTLIAEKLENVGEDIHKYLEGKMTDHHDAERQIQDLKEEILRHQDSLKQAESQGGGEITYTVEDLARVDPSMQEMYRIRTVLELETQELETRLGTANPAARASRAKLNIRNEQMNKYRDELRSKYFIMPTPTGSKLEPRDLSSKEAVLSRLVELARKQQEEIEQLGQRSHQVDMARITIQRSDEALILANKKIDEMQHELLMGQTFRVIDLSSQASVASQKNIAFGALGFLFGGALPVGFFVLAGLMNPRFRFSDEATGKPTTGLTLLGILPDLPDRLSDPEQASIAAHCVHQIRTMLQINTGSGLEDRRVFAITSAAPGDGKTSLTLALGLSYAACGTRTLLIDCDLIGSGLTSRMNVAAAEGVLEAISHRSLLEYVRTTDIADVSILPVGSSQHLHASTLSPAALRRLIEEAKKHFDTILIDTGPVLGSIEASLVAAAADAVVLAVSRGQQRPLVERTVQHLQHIKANLAGVVFNRAKSADFDRSISGASLRSASSSGPGHNARGTRMGPVARAVQSAFKPAGEDTEAGPN